MHQININTMVYALPILFISVKFFESKEFDPITQPVCHWSSNFIDVLSQSSNFFNGTQQNINIFSTFFLDKLINECSKFDSENLEILIEFSLV